MKNSAGVVVGDHYVHVLIDIPKEISKEEIKTYQYLQELANKRY